MVAAVNLLDAIRKSREYEQQLNRLLLFSYGDSYITDAAQKLKKNASGGTASIKDLQAEYEALAHKLSINILQNKLDKNFLENFIVKFSSFMSVSKIKPEENTSEVQDILAKAGNEIKSANFEQAIKELKNLSSANISIFSSWLVKAEDYVTVNNTAESILQYTMR